VRDAYVIHIQRMLELAGLDDAPARAKRVFELETEIARRHWDNVTTRDSEKTYNPMEWASIRDLFVAGLPTGSATVSLDQWASSFGAPDHAFSEVVVREPSFFRDLGELFDEVRLDSCVTGCAGRSFTAMRPICRRISSMNSSTFMDEPSRALSSFASVGSAECHWSREYSARRWAKYTWSATSPGLKDSYGRVGRELGRGIPSKHLDARVDDAGDP